MDNDFYSRVSMLLEQTAEAVAIGRTDYISIDELSDVAKDILVEGERVREERSILRRIASYHDAVRQMAKAGESTVAIDVTGLAKTVVEAYP